MESEITQEEIISLMKNRGLTIEKMVNAIVDVNNIIGVGLVTLAQTLYILTFYNKELRKPNITKEEIDEIVNRASKVKLN